MKKKETQHAVLYFRTLLVSMINNTEDSSDYILTVIGVGAGVILALITAVVIFTGIFHNTFI